MQKRPIRRSAVPGDSVPPFSCRSCILDLRSPAVRDEAGSWFPPQADQPRLENIPEITPHTTHIIFFMIHLACSLLFVNPIL